ncbi:c-type cytochrome [bacterium]|nr:c-type cytochrome [bacterium]
MSWITRTIAAALALSPLALPYRAAAQGGDARQQAQEIFAGRCTPCHGAQGKGDGAASKGLTPPPRNFSDPAWQQSVTDDHIEKIIKYGGAAVGKSPAMPANPDLNAKPQVVIELREIVRGFGK